MVFFYHIIRYTHPHIFDSFLVQKYDSIKWTQLHPNMFIGQSKESFVTTIGNFSQLNVIKHKANALESEMFVQNVPLIHNLCYVISKELRLRLNAVKPGQNHRYKLIQKSYTDELVQLVHTKGKALVQKRVEKWNQVDVEIADALSTEKWGEIWSIRPQLSSYNQYFWYRFHLSNFNTYDNSKKTQAMCPEITCQSDMKESFYHVVWQCPTSQKIWRQLLAGWLGHSVVEANHFKVEIFSFNLTRIPHHFLRRKKSTKEVQNDNSDQIIQVAKEAWRIFCKVIPSQLWYLRNENFVSFKKLVVFSKK